MARQERRQRSLAKRARRRRFFMAGGLIIALMLITGLALPSFGITNTTPTAPQARETAGTQVAIQEGDLLEPGETAEYDTSPPTSGPSWAEAATWGVHEQQVADEAVVRNLRNGGIVFNHNLSGDQRAELQTLVESLPGYPDCYVLQPHADVGEGEIELTAWGWLDRLTPGEIDAMRNFADDHRANTLDAESRGESCGAGSA